MTNLLIRLFVKDYENTQSPHVHAGFGRLAGWMGIVCNLLLAAGKLLAGFLSGSIAIMADAVNNFSDASSSVITLVGFKMAAKPADKEHPFGHARFEYIAALAVALLVMAVGLNLGRSSIEKIIAPQEVAYSWLTMVILAASVLAKLWMAAFNKNIGGRIGSGTLAATSADSRNDAIATGAVLAAALFDHFAPFSLDGWMGLGVAVFILISGFGLVKDTLDPLLGTAPDAELVEHVSRKISAYPGVLGTHDLIVHDYGPGRRFASAHVEMASEMDVLESHDIIDNIERDFLEQENLHLIIHYDPIVTGDGAVNDARTKVAQVVAEIDPALSIHDFRMVDGPSHTNYIFDVVVPPEYPASHDDLIETIRKAVQTGGKPIHLVVTVDESYAAIPT